jgi:hypothetical protein
MIQVITESGGRKGAMNGFFEEKEEERSGRSRLSIGPRPGESPATPGPSKSLGNSRLFHYCVRRVAGCAVRRNGYTAARLAPCLVRTFLPCKRKAVLFEHGYHLVVKPVHAGKNSPGQEVLTDLALGARGG